MTLVRTDGGTQDDIASLGPAKASFLPAGFTDSQVATGHVLFQGFSAENAGNADNSIQAEGTVTGPTASQIIAFVSLPQGTWLISWTIGYGSGAVAAAEQNNMKLEGPVSLLLGGVIPAVANTEVPQQSIVWTGSGNVGVQAIAAGTATAVYEAQIVATPVASGLVRFYDGRGAPTKQVATSALAELASETEWLGDNGVELEMGLWVVATTPGIAVTCFYLIVQDE